MRKILLFFTIFCFLLPLQPSHARDLHGRLGVGYNGQFQPSENDDFFNRANAISLKYGLMKGVAVAAVFGASTSSPVSTVAALKLFANLFYETNLNFYAMAAGGLVSANSTTGFEILGGFGTEFFFPGLESVGFSFEVGASASNISGSFALRTVGSSILDAGIHFYF